MLLSWGKISTLDKIINLETIKFFTSSKFNDNAILDKNKIVEKNIKNFGLSISAVMNNINSNLHSVLAQELLEDIFITLQKSYIVNKQRDKMIKELYPALRNMDVSYLLNNKKQISSKIETFLIANNTPFSEFANVLKFSIKFVDNSKSPSEVTNTLVVATEKLQQLSKDIHYDYLYYENKYLKQLKDKSDIIKARSDEESANQSIDSFADNGTDLSDLGRNWYSDYSSSTTGNSSEIYEDIIHDKFG